MSGRPCCCGLSCTDWWNCTPCAAGSSKLATVVNVFITLLVMLALTMFVLETLPQVCSAS
eukprot:SAG31_NODE_12802_length_915_cov_1.420343_1_plen_59_part_10